MSIWQKYLKVLGQVSSTLPSSASKYQVFWISKCQVQVSTTKYMYSRFCIKYQVQVLYLTPTLHHTGQGPCLRSQLHLAVAWGVSHMKDNDLLCLRPRSGSGWGLLTRKTCGKTRSCKKLHSQGFQFQDQEFQFQFHFWIPPSIPIDQSHRCGHRQAACRESAGSYDKTTEYSNCYMFWT